MVSSRTKWLVCLICFGLVFIFGLNVVAVVFAKMYTDPSCDENVLPQINIELNDISLDQLNSGDKDTKYYGNSAEIESCNEIKLYQNVEIKGRGNSTWGQYKNPYQIKFKEKVDLFGMGKARKWVLLANVFDDSNLRTDIAFYLEKLLGEPFALKGEFAEVTIDGEYLGLYYITQKVEIDKTRVSINEPTGILVELDNLHKEEEGILVAGNFLQIKDLVADDKLEEATDDFMAQLRSLKQAVDKRDLATVEELVDIDSMVRFYLLQEFMLNPDAYCSSFYMYKDGEEDKIHFGPGWDFDFSLGNEKWIWGEEEEFYSPFDLTIKDYYSSSRREQMFWFVENEEFEELVKKMYQERMAGKKQELLDYIDERAKVIRQAALHDAGQWGIDFETELSNLKSWVADRFDYFEEVYGGWGKYEKHML